MGWQEACSLAQFLRKDGMVLRGNIPTSVYANSRVICQVSAEPVRYDEAIDKMDAHVAAIAQGREPERIWFLEHPPIYTAGTSAKREDLVDADRFPIFESGRGGQFTYHGPGQRVVYVMLNLVKRGGDVRAFVSTLENWLIATLAQLGVIGERREDRVGVWVQRPGREDKIAALGIRVRKGITFHGISINLNPNLEHFSGIVPCGIAEHGVTSFHDLGLTTTMQELDSALKSNFAKIFQSESNS